MILQKIFHPIVKYFGPVYKFHTPSISDFNHISKACVSLYVVAVYGSTNSIIDYEWQQYWWYDITVLFQGDTTQGLSINVLWDKLIQYCFKSYYQQTLPMQSVPGHTMFFAKSIAKSRANYDSRQGSGSPDKWIHNLLMIWLLAFHYKWSESCQRLLEKVWEIQKYTFGG